ncbi:hypothetical protein FS837_002724 [Tulasnella sp. UAMH 9824]|nr:hypothetical protein FS837_002724 [Tulasnella sp. UAMH 9824]
MDLLRPELEVDNLKPGVKYVTTWNRGGLTNEFITWINLIHLAHVSQRVPVLPPLLPDEEHLGRGGTALDASDIFDIPRLAKTLTLPILEWSQLKQARYHKSYIPADQESHYDDELLGCWGTYPAVGEDYDPSYAFTPHFLHLNVQYTAAPANISTPSNSSPFPGLAEILSPSGRAAALSLSPSTWAEELISPTPEPDEQLACFDGLYSDTEGQWEKDLGRTWDLVGTNMHFTRKMDLLANSILRRIFDLREFDVVPLFISVHIRRGDLDYFCENPNRPEGCLPSLSAYAARVREIQDDLRQIHGQDSIYGNVAEVIVTSDETDSRWWAEVEDMGWKETGSLKQELQLGYGIWFPPVMDAVIQSKGAGFVGTSDSTMSVIAAKRVLDWQGGPSRMGAFSDVGPSTSLPDNVEALKLAKLYINTELDALISCMQHRRNLAASIHKLPIEVMDMIFAAYTESSSLNDIPSLFDLAAVNKLWYDTIVHSPQLWTTLESDFTPKIAKLVLQRSKNLPFDLIWDTADCDESESKELLDVVAQNSTRLKSVKMTVTECWKPNRDIRRLLEANMPNLEKLEVKTVWDSEVSGERLDKITLSDGPSLRKIA